LLVLTPIHPTLHKLIGPLGWDERQPYHPWRTVNWLMPREQRDPISDQTNLKVNLCRVSRA